MITLGIDPGTALLGFGVIASNGEPHVLDYGAVVTSAHQPMPQRLAELFDAVTGLLERHQPDVVAIEQLGKPAAWFCLPQQGQERRSWNTALPRSSTLSLVTARRPRRKCRRW